MHFKIVSNIKFMLFPSFNFFSELYAKSNQSLYYVTYTMYILQHKRPIINKLEIAVMI